jgi:hypothetical protein
MADLLWRASFVIGGDGGAPVYTASNDDRTILRTAGGSGWLNGWLGQFVDKRYFEIHVDVSAGSTSVGFAVTNTSWSVDTNAAAIAGMWNVDASLNYQYTANGVEVGTIFSGSIATGHKLMVAVDPVAGKMWLGRNGTWYNSGDPATGVNPISTGLPAELKFVASIHNTAVDTQITSPLPGELAYAIPEGFQALDAPSINAEVPAMTGHLTGYFESGATFSGALHGEIPALTGHMTTAIAATMHGRWSPDQKLVSRMVTGARMSADIPRVTSKMVANTGVSAAMHAKVPAVTGKMTTGARMSAPVPEITATISAGTTYSSRIHARVPAITARMTTFNSSSCRLQADVPVIRARMTGLHIDPSHIHAKVPALVSRITAVSGVACTINAKTPKVYSRINAAFMPAGGNHFNGIVPVITGRITASSEQIDYGILRYRRGQVA